MFANGSASSRFKKCNVLYVIQVLKFLKGIVNITHGYIYMLHWECSTIELLCTLTKLNVTGFVRLIEMFYSSPINIILCYLHTVYNFPTYFQMPSYYSLHSLLTGAS